MEFVEATGKQLENKKKKGICCVVGCGKRAERNRNGRGEACIRKYCSTHRGQYQRAKYPYRDSYRKLKSNAKRRGKVFTITFEWFKQWCEDNNYISLRGRYPGMFTIDRMDDKKGYEPGNLKIMEHGQNCRKRFIDKWLDVKYGSGGGYASHQESYEECDANENQFIQGDRYIGDDDKPLPF